MVFSRNPVLAALPDITNATNNSLHVSKETITGKKKKVKQTLLLRNFKTIKSPENGQPVCPGRVSERTPSFCNADAIVNR